MSKVGRWVFSMGREIVGRRISERGSAGKYIRDTDMDRVYIIVLALVGSAIEAWSTFFLNCIRYSPRLGNSKKFFGLFIYLYIQLKRSMAIDLHARVPIWYLAFLSSVYEPRARACRF
ncbi:hypothetical protein K440DRAFT_22915 [Wilcoxina mikolae CBS 423.85]|nr:hypothetical protein K440DRAFT_22915 [Wilcoxina mikolae CBS 423.85]